LHFLFRTVSAVLFCYWYRLVVFVRGEVQLAQQTVKILELVFAQVEASLAFIDVRG
jgi:hypothetical protein